MKHIIRECILEYQLTYMGERLFGASIPRAFMKAMREAIRCLIDLIKPYNSKDTF